MLVLTVGDVPTLTGSVQTAVTGASLEAHIKRPDATVVTRSCTIVDAPTGKWSCALQAADLNQAGDYLLEIQVTFAGPLPLTFAVDADSRDVRFRVRNQYA